MVRWQRWLGSSVGAVVLAALSVTERAAAQAQAPREAATPSETPAAAAPAGPGSAAAPAAPVAPASQPSPHPSPYAYQPATAPPPPPGYATPYFPAYFPPGVPIELVSTEPGVGIDVYAPSARVGVDPPIVACDAACRVVVAPGTYKIFVRDTEDTVSGSREIDVSRPMRITMDPDTVEHRSVGLGLGIAGPIAMIVGIVVVIGSWQDCGHGDYDYAYDGRRACGGNDSARALGILSLVGGLTATPVGWVMFGTSFKPEYSLDPLSSSPYGGARSPQRARLELDLRPGPRGLALTGTF